MKASRHLSLLLVLVAILASCSGGQQRPRRNTIAYNFGAARQEMVIKHTFQVPNTSKETLTISRVQTTCGCTSTVVKQGTPIPAGGTLDVPIELNLRGKEGEVDSKVILYYGPQSIPTELALHGSVKKEFEDGLAFAKIKKGDQPEMTVELKTFPGQPELVVSDITYDKTKFEVTSTPGKAPGECVIHVKPVAAPEYGPLDGEIVVHTNDKEVPDKTIHAHAHVMKPLEASKGRLTLTQSGAEKEASGIAEFVSPYGGAIESPSVSVTRPKRFTATIEPDSPAGTLRVRVSGTPPEGKEKQYMQTTLSVTAKVNGEEITEKMEVYYMLNGAKAALTDEEAEAKRVGDTGKPKGRDHEQAKSPAEAP